MELEKKPVKLLIMSDTHNTHYKVDVKALPEADIFIHCGDFTCYSQKKEHDNFR